MRDPKRVFGCAHRKFTPARNLPVAVEAEPWPLDLPHGDVEAPVEDWPEWTDEIVVGIPALAEAKGGVR